MRKNSGDTAMNKNANWIGIRKGEINYWDKGGYTTAMLEQLIGKVRVERRSLLFRSVFTLGKEVAHADLKICGLGFYRAFVNGKEPDSTVVLAPLYNDYSRRVLFDRYNVTDLLVSGKNCISVEVGCGWFCPPEKWWNWRSAWYGNPRMISELTVTFSDGETKSFVSDESWYFTYGGVIKSCIYDGEHFDAREEPLGWCDTDYDHSAWQKVSIVEAPKGALEERYAPPVRITKILKPVNILKIDDCHFVYDFGENCSALPCITVKGNSGDSIILNHAEFCKENGHLDTRSNNLAECEDLYILRGGEAESYRPRFTSHCFRYMMVTLSSPDISILCAESHVIHSDVETVGSFSCNREDLNRMHDVIVRTALSCLLGVPVDCPQRDERLPWLGDVHASSEVFFYNFDMEKLYESFLEDIYRSRDSRGVVQIITPRAYYEETSIDWNVTYPALLLEHYQRYGNIDLLRYHFKGIKEHTNYYVSVSENGLIDNCWFGDWFSVDQKEGVKRSLGFSTSEEGDNQNPPYNGSLFYYLTLNLSAEIADVIGETETADFWRRQAEITRQSIIKTYYNAENGVFGRGGQFSQTFPLALNILRGEDRKKAFSVLLEAFEEHDGHSVMGVMGLRRIFDLFVSEGMPEKAYELLTKKGYPGILHMTDNGNTTLTEGLAGNGSGCHIMFGSPDAVLYRLLGGITVDRRLPVPVTVAPFIPDDLTFVNCEQKLREGTLVANWKKENGKTHYHLEIPENLRVNFRMAGECEFRTLTHGVYDFCE